jgi:hypothetical protein
MLVAWYVLGAATYIRLLRQQSGRLVAQNAR